MIFQEFQRQNRTFNEINLTFKNHYRIQFRQFERFPEVNFNTDGFA